MTAESARSISISFDDVHNAYEFVSSGAKSESEAYISASTGKIYYVSSVTGDDELPEDAEGSDDYISVPHKNDLDLGRDLVFSFVQDELPAVWDEVRDMFQRRGAYGRFKDLLQRCGRMEAWYAYEERETKKALRAWCEEVGIQLSDAPNSTDGG
jgi:hypothetical protein